MTSHKIHMEEDTPNLTLLRTNDSFLMNRFWEAGYKGAELAQINRCRMFLCVTTVSDIATGDGRSILQSALKGQRNPFQTERYSWPQQGPPTKDNWSLWEAALTRTLVSWQPRTLAAPLGQWLDKDTPWQTYFSPDEQQIYTRENDAWRAWTTIPRRCRGNGRTSFR